MFIVVLVHKASSYLELGLLYLLGRKASLFAVELNTTVVLAWLEVFLELLLMLLIFLASASALLEVLLLVAVQPHALVYQLLVGVMQLSISVSIVVIEVSFVGPAVVPHIDPIS